ncbi:hypothetical protein [Lysobacter xanthus]
MRDERDNTGSGRVSDSREGDPRKRDGQDERTASPRTDESGKAKDDVSRAPESGTP